MSVIRFFREVFDELSKVTWPTRKELWNSLMVVIATLIFFATFLFLVDTGLQGLATKYLYSTPSPIPIRSSSPAATATPTAGSSTSIPVQVGANGQVTIVSPSPTK